MAALQVTVPPFSQADLRLLYTGSLFNIPVTITDTRTGETGTAMTAITITEARPDGNIVFTWELIPAAARTTVVPGHRPGTFCIIQRSSARGSDHHE